MKFFTPQHKLKAILNNPSQRITSNAQPFLTILFYNLPNRLNFTMN